MLKTPSLEQLAELVGNLETFTSDGGQVFVRLPEDAGGISVYPLHSHQFRLWCFNHVYGNCYAVASSHNLNAIQTLLESSAGSASVFRRVGARGLDRSLSRQIILDLGGRRFVTISPDVWNVSESDPYRDGEDRDPDRDSLDSEAPTLFATSRSTWDLCPPVASPPATALATLRSLLNLPSQSAWLQCLAWLVSTLRPFGPQPFLILQGPPDSGKSVSARILRSIIDPNAANLTPVPASVLALLAVARQNWILAFDHVSALSPKVTDALCRLSTGLGASLRETSRPDPEPVQQYFRRPVILTAAPGFTCPPDLAARAFVIDLPPLPPERQRPELEILDTFRQAAPAILGVLCSAASAALSRLSQTLSPSSPSPSSPRREAGVPFPNARLCDTLIWFLAAAPALELSQDEICQSLAAPPPPHPLVDAVRALLEHCQRWTGSATELLELLAPLFPGSNPSGLSQRLRGSALALADCGIELKFSRLPGGNRVLELQEPCDRDSENTPKSLSQNSDPSPQLSESKDLKVA